MLNLFPLNSQNLNTFAFTMIELIMATVSKQRKIEESSSTLQTILQTILRSLDQLSHYRLFDFVPNQSLCQSLKELL